MKCAVGFALLFSAALVRCSNGKDSPVGCTLEARTAVRVTISSPAGLPVTSVTAEHMSEAPCDGGATNDAGTEFSYSCWEQGNGRYVVRVTSGDLTWTKEVDVSGDECHTTEVEQVDFVLDESTADS